MTRAAWGLPSRGDEVDPAMRLTLTLASLLVSFTGIGFVACSQSSPAAGGDDDGGVAGDSGAAPVEAGGDATADAHVDAPPRPEIPNNGGPVVASPEIVTISWQGDPLSDGLEAFDDWLVASATWTTMMGEWGVGAGKHLGSWRVPSAAPMTLDDTDVRKLLVQAFADGSIPPPNGSRVYTVYPPAGTDVTSFGAKGCAAFQAYHSSFEVASSGDGGAPALAIYAITPRCDGGAAYGMQPLDYVTWGQSHEIMEAASDPDVAHPTWLILAQTAETPEPGENADLCTGNPVRVDGHMITRNYSNAAAAHGARVCVPAPAGPDFGGFVDPDEITVKPGEQRTVDVLLYANGPMPAFTFTAYAASRDLTVTQDKKTGTDGDVVKVTIAAAPTYIEQRGQNLVLLFASAQGYASRRALIVHAR
jgi:hypothetical protein